MRLGDLDALEHEFMTRMRYLEKDMVMDAAYIVNKFPAVDAVPVVHGRWTEKERIMYDSMREEDVHWFTYVCSVCAGEVMNNTNYCPNCGARMDGDCNG